MSVDLFETYGVEVTLNNAIQVLDQARAHLDDHYPGKDSYTMREVLEFAGLEGRRHAYLGSRLKKAGVVDAEGKLDRLAAANALTAFCLFKHEHRFDAVCEQMRRIISNSSTELSYTSVWARLIEGSLQRVDRLIPARLLGAVVSALTGVPHGAENGLVMVRRRRDIDAKVQSWPEVLTSEMATQWVRNGAGELVWAVIAPTREVMFLPEGRTPNPSEFGIGRFTLFQTGSRQGQYEVVVGTPNPPKADQHPLPFVAGLLDIIFLLRTREFDQSVNKRAQNREARGTKPDLVSEENLELWLVTQLLSTVWKHAIIEIFEVSPNKPSRILADSRVDPWQPNPFDPPEELALLSGYAARINVPLVVKDVRAPMSEFIDSWSVERQYLEQEAPGVRYDAISIPISTVQSAPIGVLYAAIPAVEQDPIDDTVKSLTILARIVGEIIERQREAVLCNVECGEEVTTQGVLEGEVFRDKLIGLLAQQSSTLQSGQDERRFPVIVVAAHCTHDSQDMEPVQKWLGDTLRYLPWRMFVRPRLSRNPELTRDLDGVLGRISPTAMAIAINRMVSKDQLDQIRDAFPSGLNRISPSNAKAKLVTWVIDIPAHEILSARNDPKRQAGIAVRIIKMATEVAQVVDYVTQGTRLLQVDGDWYGALNLIETGLDTPTGKRNPYLHRRAADCYFATGEWASALKHAQEAIALETVEQEYGGALAQTMGSGSTRSLCLKGDAHLCLGATQLAWACYKLAAEQSPMHPLPTYYRGQALLFLARLLREFQHQTIRQGLPTDHPLDTLDSTVKDLARWASDELAKSSRRLSRWGVLPEEYEYRNFNLVPAWLGQGSAFLLAGSPDIAAMRFQRARRDFPKDDMILREFIFAKCLEQKLHQEFGKQFQEGELREWISKLHAEFDGEANP